MGSKSRGLPASAALSERQAYWLKHIRAAEGRGEPLKQYAARKGLSEHSLYEAKRRLRDLGVLAAASPRKQTPAPARFARVAVSPSPGLTGSASPLRVRLPSGAVVEWSEAPAGEALRALLGMLAG